MLHLSDGVLRRNVDEPQALGAEERAHLDGCADCARRSRALAGQADAIGMALDAKEGTALDLATARASVVSRAKAPGGVPRRRIAAPLVGGLAAAALVALFVAIAPLRTLAQNFLAIFEPREIVAIPMTRSEIGQLRAIPDLSSFGIIRRGLVAQTLRTTSAEQAVAFARMPILLPHVLPPITGHWEFMARTAGSATFTFSAAKTKASAALLGRPLPPMPSHLDGSTLFVTIGPVVIASYGEEANTASYARRHGTDLPPLVVAQAPVPRIGSTGASAREIEEYLLSVPGVPPRLAAEIRAIGDPATTLPIPIPIDRASATRVRVQGVDGLAIGDDTGVGSGVVWRRGTAIYAVAGTLPLKTLLTVADSLR